MAGWEEERWFSRFQRAVLSERLDRPPAEVRELYLASYLSRPTRADRCASWRAITAVAMNSRSRICMRSRPPISRIRQIHGLSMGLSITGVPSTNSVKAADISAVKANMNRLADNYTYRFDLDNDGTVTETDLSAVKARIRLGYPLAAGAIDYRC